MFNAFRILLTSLLLLLGSMVLSGPDIAQGQPFPPACTDGQVMTGGNKACSCRPPLKFLPGNICGSGKKPLVSPTAPNTQGVRALCEIGMIPAASGCRCEAPLALLPGGRCGNPTLRGAACREGDHIKATRCICNPPLMQTARTFRCIRCLPGDGDKIVNGKCQVAKRS